MKPYEDNFKQQKQHRHSAAPAIVTSSSGEVFSFPTSPMEVKLSTSALLLSSCCCTKSSSLTPSAISPPTTASSFLLSAKMYFPKVIGALLGDDRTARTPPVILPGFHSSRDRIAPRGYHSVISSYILVFIVVCAQLIPLARCDASPALRNSNHEKAAVPQFGNGGNDNVASSTSDSSSSASSSSVANAGGTQARAGIAKRLASTVGASNGAGLDDSSTTARPRLELSISSRQLHKDGQPSFESPWTWSCSDGISCKREFANGTGTAQVSLNVCWLTCGTYGALWPYPTVKTFLGSQLVGFFAQNAEVVAINAPHKAVKAMLGYAGNVLLDHLFRMSPKDEDQEGNQRSRSGFEHNYLAITLTAQNTDTRISLTTDESYNLTISTFYGTGGSTQVNVDIVGATYFGVRHGLETLGQLIAYDEFNKCLRVVKEVAIEDRPAFAYRGLMIDTARNFVPILYLKRVVDAMSYNKMNMMHLHITDTNSFPFYSKRIPHMTTYGAYSKSQIYTPKDIKELVLYARLRGVKIIPELDAPAHAGNGWQWGPLEGLGDLALCVNAEPWRSYCGQPPCGQLNPINNYTYLVLRELYTDFLEVFDKDVFHMGGDEVFFQCWYYHNEIRNWLHNRGTHDLMDLWGHFQEKAFQMLVEANGGHYIKPIVWTSDMTSRGRNFLSPNDYIIQVWTGSSHSDVRELLQEKYKIIYSNVDAAYLDHGYGSWLGRDHMWTIKTWQNLYDNDLIKITEYHLGSNATYHALAAGQILGGEATLWAEKVDMHNLEPKLWPRSSAFAERLWSSPRNRTNSVYPRLIHHRARMVRRGIHADRLQPESCHQITGYCSDPASRL